MYKNGNISRTHTSKVDNNISAPLTCKTRDLKCWQCPWKYRLINVPNENYVEQNTSNSSYTCRYWTKYIKINYVLKNLRVSKHSLRIRTSPVFLVLDPIEKNWKKQTPKINEFWDLYPLVRLIWTRNYEGN